MPITHLAARRLEVPGVDHLPESVLEGAEPLTSSARSLRVVEVLAAAEHAATRGGRAA